MTAQKARIAQFIPSTSASPLPKRCVIVKAAMDKKRNAPRFAFSNGQVWMGRWGQSVI